MIVAGTMFVASLVFTAPSRAASSVSLAVSPQIVPQGGTASITLMPMPEGTLSSVKGDVDGMQITFFSYRGRFIGFWSAPAKTSAGWHILTVFADGSRMQTKIGVKSGEFSTSGLASTPEFQAKGFTPGKVAANLGNDGSALTAAASRPSPAPLFSSAFGDPLGTLKVTGPYGDFYRQGSITLEHLGVDLTAATGTPVYAVNGGVVRFADALTNYGDTVMIDHGARIFSLSMHLSRFAVAPGDAVIKGQVIGYSGETGYALGPHLHLSMWVNGASIDPLAFIAATQQAMQQ